MNVIEMVERLFEQYGYLVLLIGLPLDFIALPIPPGNSTLAYTGYLSYKGILDLLPASGFAFFGAALGFTITYLLGYKLGMPLIERYGKWLFLKPSLVEKTQAYYDKYGNKLLLVCFFVPGVRQFIGYFIGIIRVPYRTIWLYGYAGIAAWTAVFIGVGYIFGERWQAMFALLEHYLKVVAVCLAGALLIWLLLKGIRAAAAKKRVRAHRISHRDDSRREGR
ncbi:DedA family protein [Paenibacillaceae bacterium WGS1546]|uniref:DedA family protein n=1 Tax=Cohnella sp. WGS1546 TaxID=3366810 RepID=UPI00372CF341